MGTKEEIENVLMREREPKLTYEPTTFRAALPQNGHPESKYRSPLTAQQISSLQQRAYGVHLLFGFAAAGFNEVIQSFRHEFKDDFVLIDDALTRHDFAKRLTKELDRRRSDGTTVIAISADCAWGCAWIAEAQEHLRRLQSKTAFAQIMFLADAPTAWTLFSQEAEEIERLKADNLKLINLRAWHDSALRHWLEECNFAVGKRDLLTAATGNWSSLLYRFHEKAQTESAEWEKNIEDFRRQTEENCETILVADFGLQHGNGRRILTALAEFSDGQGETISPHELAELLEIPFDDLRVCLIWADALGLVQPAKLGWRVESTVARLLKQANENSVKVI